LEIKPKKLTATSFVKFGKTVDANLLKQPVGIGNIKFRPATASFNIDGEIEIELCQVKKESNNLKLMEKRVKTQEMHQLKATLLPVAVSHNPLDVAEFPRASDVEALYMRSNQALIMNNGV